MIQHTEQEWKEFYNRMLGGTNCDLRFGIAEFLKDLRLNNYIKKNSIRKLTYTKINKIDRRDRK